MQLHCVNLAALVNYTRDTEKSNRWNDSTFQRFNAPQPRKNVVVLAETVSFLLQLNKLSECSNGSEDNHNLKSFPPSIIILEGSINSRPKQ